MSRTMAGLQSRVFVRERGSPSRKRMREAKDCIRSSSARKRRSPSRVVRLAASSSRFFFRSITHEEGADSRR
jgi:hypothetical protein